MSDFRPFTPRIIFERAEANRREQWMHTSWMLATISNVVAMKQSDIRYWYQFHPYYNGTYATEHLAEDEDRDHWDQFDPDNPETWMKGGGVDKGDLNAAVLVGWGKDK